jgi:hypothetical protein
MRAAAGAAVVLERGHGDTTGADGAAAKQTLSRGTVVAAFQNCKRTHARTHALFASLFHVALTTPFSRFAVLCALERTRACKLAAARGRYFVARQCNFSNNHTSACWRTAHPIDLLNVLSPPASSTSPTPFNCPAPRRAVSSRHRRQRPHHSTENISATWNRCAVVSHWPPRHTAEA